MADNKTRVFKNTVSLYIRMIFLTVISLFTFRVVLHSLGEIDYGLYNVVGGFVGLFAFVSGTLEVASQRYFAISLARNDWEGLNKYFSINLKIYVLFIGIILLLSETVGLWFVMNKLTIPDERMTAAVFVYEFSVFSFCFSFITSPFRAILISDENMGIYSVISIVEGIFKVVIAFIVYYIGFDKLITYGFLYLVVSFIINFFYMLYCRHKYPLLKFVKSNDKKTYKEIFSFMNWNLIGAFGTIGKGQGINIIMNMFFSAAINSARAIGLQINNIVASFSENFLKALDPQITKKYALADTSGLKKLLYSSSKISYYLLMVLVYPLIINIHFLLGLWLGSDLPDYTVEFAVLALFEALVQSFTSPVSTTVQATGKVKALQLSVGLMSFLNIPFAYVILLLVKNPMLPVISTVIVSVFMSAGRIIVLRVVYDKFSILDYIKNVIIPIILVTAILAVCFPLYKYIGTEGFVSFIIKAVVSFALAVGMSYFIGFNRYEKDLIKGFAKSFKAKFTRK